MGNAPVQDPRRRGEFQPAFIAFGLDDRRVRLGARLADPGQRVDLVIVDLFLKSGSGLGVLRATGADPRHFGLVVL